MTADEKEKKKNWNKKKSGNTRYPTPIFFKATHE